jgi:flagellar basal body-associated protein FliL
MKRLLPILIALFGLVGGAGAGWWLKPPPAPEAEPCLDAEGHEQEPDPCAADEAADEEALEAPYDGDYAELSEFVELRRQFIVPVVSQSEVASLVVLTLSLETEPGKVEPVLAREPKLRDALLRVLFDHAATGGFFGDFTAEPVMRDLRRNLRKAARLVAGPAVRDVLVTEIMRQDA